MLIPRYDLAWGARADGEVMTHLRITRIGRLVDICGARRGHQGHVGANWSRTACLPIRRLLDQMLASRLGCRAATAYGIDVLSYTLLSFHGWNRWIR